MKACSIRMSGLKYLRSVYLEHLLNPPEEHHVPAFQLGLDTLEFHGKGPILKIYPYEHEHTC